MGGQETAEAMRVAWKEAWRASNKGRLAGPGQLAYLCSWHDGHGIAVGVIRSLPTLAENGLSAAQFADLVREMFGTRCPPLAAPVPHCPAAVFSLAQAAYDERELPGGHLDNARLAVLSDALEEAGCTDETILSHLRSPGPHVRGCWALDLVLGKG